VAKWTLHAGARSVILDSSSMLTLDGYLPWYILTLRIRKPINGDASNAA
jgi:hypothetical protein